MAINPGIPDETSHLGQNADQNRFHLVLKMHVGDAEALISGFTELFEKIIDDSEEDELLRSALRLRQLRATFERTRAQCKPLIAAKTTDEKDIPLATELLKLTGLYPAIAGAEKAYHEWLRELDAEAAGSILSYSVIKKIPALFDPICDVLVVAGDEMHLQRLKSLGFCRVVTLDYLKKIDESLSSNSDNDGLDRWVREIPDLDYLPPRIVSGIKTGPAESEDFDSIILNACQAVRFSLRRVLTTRNTLKYFGEQWVKNALENIQTLSKCEDFRSLKGRFAGKSVVLVGPAPSLKRDIQNLKRIQKKTYIICLSQAYRALIDANISPDFVIITDSAYMPGDFVAPMTSSQVFVFDVVTDPRHLNMIGNARRWPYVASEFKVITLQGLVGEEGLPLLRSGGSVSHTAFSLALFLGFKDIVLMGHDFCLTDGLNYMTLQDGSLSHSHGGIQPNLVTVRTNDGEEAQAPLDYDIFRKHFEMLIEHPTYAAGVRVRTTSVSGAYIRGIEPISSPDLAEEISKKRISKPSIWPCEKYPTVDSGSEQNLFSSTDLNVKSELIREWESKVTALVENGDLNTLCIFAGKVSREIPAVSLFLQGVLTDIDEGARLNMTPSRQRFLTAELAGAVSRGLGLRT